jgi:hypothetical protein
MRIRPRPPADRRAGPAADPAPGAPAGRPGDHGEPDVRARADMFWALVLRRFYDHVHRGGQEDDDDDSTR